MAPSIQGADIKSIILACEAGAGSSLMSVNVLKRKLKQAQIDNVRVTHSPAREVPADTPIVVVHAGLAKVVRAKAAQAVIVTFNHFLNDPAFDKLVNAIKDNSTVVSSLE